MVVKVPNLTSVADLQTVANQCSFVAYTVKVSQNSLDGASDCAVARSWGRESPVHPALRGRREKKRETIIRRKAIKAQSSPYSKCEPVKLLLVASEHD